MFVKQYVDMMYKVSRKLRTPIEVFNKELESDSDGYLNS